MLILTPSNFSLGAASPTSGLDWVRSPNGVVAAEHGSCAPSLLPIDNDVVLVLPPRAVSWHRVALPKVAPGRLRAALEGVLEERLLNDPAELHFALESGGRPGQTLWVAACLKSWLKSWLLVLEAAGRPVSRIVPALWPTSTGGGVRGETVHWAHDEGDRVWLATANPLGVRCVPLPENGSSTFGAFGSASGFGDSAFGGIGPAASRATDHLPTDSDPAHARWFADPTITALAEQVCNQHFDLMPPPDWLMRCAQSDWNLAQFDLSLSSGARQGQRLRQAVRQVAQCPGLAPPPAGAWPPCCFPSWAGSTPWPGWNAAASRTNTSPPPSCSRMPFPDVAVVLDAPVQMRRELVRLQQSSGALSNDDLETSLAALATLSVAAVPGGIQFVPGETRLTAWSVPADQLQTMAQELSQRGWQVSQDGETLLLRPKAE